MKLATRLAGLCLLFIVGWIALGWTSIHGQSPAADKVLFESHIVPILESRCVKCHGGEKTKSGLDLRRKFTILKGGDGGPAIVPGKPEESALWQRIEKNEMPPASEPRLSAKEKELIRRWLAAGAPLAKSSEAPLPLTADPSPQGGEGNKKAPQFTEEDRRFWAFQPPRRPAVPKVKRIDRVRTPIDAFLLQQLEARNLTFNPDAPRQVLLRRLCFDLLGLPPTPEMLAEFLADQRPDAYERLVDRLLAMPEYGERWGRHWLDLAGYADSDGYLAADRLRPEAWRYRDYVIQALNDDMPYDQFLTEQLAGDELSDWRRAEKLTPDMKRQLIATGFLRTALDPTYPGYTEPNEIHQVMSDTMQIVGSTFLGITMHCARCHEHKFDPISQRDYFSMQTVLLPALDPARWQPSGVRGIALGSDKEIAAMTQEAAKIDERLTKTTKALAELQDQYRKRKVKEALPALTKGVDAAIVEKLSTALLGDAKKRTAEQKDLIAKHAAKLGLEDADLAKDYADYKAESEKLKRDIARDQEAKKAHTPVLVRGLSDLKAPWPEGYVLRRGDYNKPGASVKAGVPEVLAPVGYKLQHKEGYKTTGRRLAFARWLTDPSHPLTARVQVNRMWAHHFGKGIVPTVANLGRSGAKPSHPELLDWLAIELMSPSADVPLLDGRPQLLDAKQAAQGVRQAVPPAKPWSLKHLHRLMVTSTAYRQTSDLDKTKAAVDPKNDLLWTWRPQRHQGEVVRDSVLAASGKLNRERFGPPAPVTAKGDGSVETSDDAQGNRRSVYLIVRRSQHLTLLELFDTPLMEVNCPERNVSTVPLQALAMLHGPFAERNARALAERLMKQEPKDDAARVRLAYRLLFTREPTAAESERLLRFVAEVAKDNSTNPVAAWTQAALVWMNSNEFLYVP